MKKKEIYTVITNGVEGLFVDGSFHSLEKAEEKFRQSIKEIRKIAIDEDWDYEEETNYQGTHYFIYNLNNDNEYFNIYIEKNSLI